MTSLIRLTYASVTTSLPEQLRHDLVSILDKSSSHNFNANVHGALLFGNNYFYQCLEGNKQDVESIFVKITKDQRHKNVTVISSQPISIMAFSKWQMKYVQLNSQVNQFFYEQGMTGFNPYQVIGDVEERFLAHLVRIEEGNAEHHGLIPGSWGSVRGAGCTIKITIHLAGAALIVLIGILLLL